MEDRDDSAIRRRYLASCQKKKLLRFVLNHPELVNNSNVPRHQQSDHNRLWQEITEELNSLPGPQKTWKEWRKTWQDIFRKKSPKINRFVRRGEKSTQTDQEQSSILGEDQVSVIVERTDDCFDRKIKHERISKRESTDSLFADMDETGDSETYTENVKGKRSKSYNYKARLSVDSDDMTENVTVFPETFTEPFSNANTSLVNGHSDACSLNCDKLTELDQRKMEMKKDYFDFKKDYLRQKLELMKQQTLALQGIAQALSKQSSSFEQGGSNNL